MIIVRCSKCKKLLLKKKGLNFDSEKDVKKCECGCKKIDVDMS